MVTARDLPFGAFTVAGVADLRDYGGVIVSRDIVALLPQYTQQPRKSSRTKPAYCSSKLFQAGDFIGKLGDIAQLEGAAASLLGGPAAFELVYAGGGVAKLVGDQLKFVGGAPFPAPSIANTVVSIFASLTFFGDFVTSQGAGYVTGKLNKDPCQ